MCVCVCVCRFHEPEEEIELNCEVVPYLNDNIQLSIEEYRDKLYEVATTVCLCVHYYRFLPSLEYSRKAKRADRSSITHCCGPV